MRPDRKDAAALAGLLCDLTDELLVKPRFPALLARLPALRYRSRVGSGERTCLLHKPDGEMTITYGLRMVQAKYDRDRTEAWASSREIRRFGFFGGSVEPVHTLAHTTVHEFAHLLQVVDGNRRRGSVHNAAFYRRLHELHEDGAAHEVAEALAERARAAELPLHFGGPRADEVEQRQALYDAYAALAPGDRLRVPGRGRVFRGTVLRINRKSVTLVLDGGGRLRFSTGVPFDFI